MRRPEEFADCPFRAVDCFAYDKPTGICEALTDTDFGNKKECPFYKNRLLWIVECDNIKKSRKKVKA